MREQKNMTPSRRIALVFGGVSPEHEVSILSTSKVAEGLMSLNEKTAIQVQPIYIDRDGQWIWKRVGEGVLPGEADILEAPQWELDPERWGATIDSCGQALVRLGDERFDVAMLILHGPGGEDGRIQGAMDLIGIPYTGSGVAASSLALDKPRCQAVFRASGLSIPTSVSISGGGMGGAERIIELVGLPCIIKPATGGSSVGMSIVREASELRPALEMALAVEANATIMAERFIAGREFTCGLLERDGELLALPITEVLPPEGRFFDYEAKYQPGISREVTPAEIAPGMAVRMQTLARRAHEACGCRGFSRVDMIADGEEILILEINTLPGMTATSLLPQGAAAAGIDFPTLLGHMLESARCG